MTSPAPDLQPQASPQKQKLPEHSLWRDAPGWRNLFIGAACLTALSIGTPFLSGTAEPVSRSVQTAADMPSCPLKPGPITPGNAGKVVGFLTPQEAQDLLQRTQTQVQAQINPAYLTNQRALITPEGTQARITALVPLTMTVKIGDQVAFNGGYRDISLPCHYIPNLISTVVSPAPPAGNVAGSKQ
jgi:hypothetical protein